jgi:hypothetical protein
MFSITRDKLENVLLQYLAGSKTETPHLPTLVDVIRTGGFVEDASVSPKNLEESAEIWYVTNVMEHRWVRLAHDACRLPALVLTTMML